MVEPHAGALQGQLGYLHLGQTGLIGAKVAFLLCIWYRGIIELRSLAEKGIAARL
jgi:hypothetical protein